MTKSTLWLSIAACLTLALCLPAQGGGGPGGGGGGGGGGTPPNPCAPSAGPSAGPAPSPSPGPGPGPAPAPNPGPGGGTTPGAGPGGGTTPGAGPGGGTTPGAGGAAGAPGGPGGAGARGGAGRTGYYGRKKAKFNAEQKYWLGVVRLPWQATFLPKGGGAGYDGAELSFDEAVQQRGRPGGWKLDDLPTIVLAYDPASKKHVKTLHKLEEDKRFVSASHFFNLVRVDVRTVKDRKLRKSIGKQPVFFLFRANGERVKMLKAPRDAKKLLAQMEKIFPGDFGKSLEQGIAEMGATLARRAWVERQIRDQEDQLVDPKTGALRPTVREKIREHKTHLKELKEHKQKLVRLKPGAAKVD